MRILAFAAALALLAVPALAQQVSITVNGQALGLSPGPIEREGRVFVPLRGIFERLGAGVVMLRARSMRRRAARRFLCGSDLRKQRSTVRRRFSTSRRLSSARRRTYRSALSRNRSAQTSVTITERASFRSSRRNGFRIPRRLRPDRPDRRHHRRRRRSSRCVCAPNSRRRRARFAIGLPSSRRSSRETSKPGAFASGSTAAILRCRAAFRRADFRTSRRRRSISDRTRYGWAGRGYGGTPFDRSWSFTVLRGQTINLTITQPAPNAAVGRNFNLQGNTVANGRVKVTVGVSPSTTGQFSGNTTAGPRGNFSIAVMLKPLLGQQTITVRVVVTDPASAQTTETTLRLRLNV